nr:extracellular solute-binding protein [Deltaproteobacteria bacterium]
YALVFVNQGGTVLSYNTALVKPKDVPKSMRDLLDPKWKGKMIASDPTASGPGRATFTWLYKSLGPEYIRALGKQKIVFTRDRRSQADQIARGAYPLGIAVSNVDAKPFIDAGAPLQMVWHVKEGSYASASYGGLALVNKAPHPNAAKVYINWVLGKEGQTLLADAAGWVSRRRDVPAIDSTMELQPGVDYLPIYYEDSIFVYKTKPYMKLMKEAFGIGR